MSSGAPSLVASTAPVGPPPFAAIDAGLVAAAVAAAHHVGLLARLEAGPPATAAELAEAHGLDPHAVDVVCEVLELAGLATGEAGRWAGTWGTQLVGDIQPTAEQVLQLLRHGTLVFDAADHAQAGPRYAEMVRWLRHLTADLIAPIARDLARPGRRVLEVAAGDCPWGRALLDAEPTTDVTALDLPEVAAAARDRLAADGLPVRYLEGDVFAVDLADQFDLVIVAGFCRLHDADANVRLFGRAQQWCAPGGDLVVGDAVDTAPARRGGLARYALSLATRSQAGRTWSLDHYARWLTDAGFEGIDVTHTARPELTVLRARRTD